MEKGNRLLWLDCLKIFSTFLIVMQHSISYEWIQAVSESTNISYIINLLFMLSKSGVPLFFMCSGMGMLQKSRTIKEIYCKNTFNLLRIYSCWMLIYGFCEVYRLFTLNTLTVRTGINALIKSIIFGQYHTWFIATLLALYAVIPFLQKITSDGILLKYYIFLSILFTILLPYIGRIESLNRLYTVITDMNMHFVLGYSLYFVLGYYLSTFEFSPKKKYSIIAALFLIILFGSLYSFHLSLSIGSECQSTYNDFSIIGFLISVSIFLTFKCLFSFNQKKSIRFIQDTATLGIGIYLFHPILLPLFKNFSSLWCLVGGLLLYFISFIIVKLISILPIRYYFLSIKK